MEEQASFEARAVLVPRRARLARLALLVPVVALVATAWAGLSGPRSDPTTAVTAMSPDPTTVAVPSLVVEAPYPAEVIGLAVQPLGEFQIGGVGLEAVVAIGGWYVPTAITDCQPLATMYRDGTLPYVPGKIDSWAFCVRSGVLYPSRPDLPGAVPAGVAVTVVAGVVMPPELEAVEAHATRVVLVGRFSKPSDGCRVGIGCSRELVVDQVAWTLDA